MTTTAHEDQFTTATQTIERVHAPYDPIAILRQNVADLEVALKQQTERAEAAEGELESVREDNHSMMVEINGLREELARLRKQKPVAWCDPVEFKDDPWSFQGFRCRTSNYPTMPLYAAPVHAPAVPAVPDGWMEWGGGSVPPVLKDDQHNYEFLRRDGQLAAFVTNWQHGIEGIGTRDIVAYRRKACVLQSAEVRHD